MSSVFAVMVQIYYHYVDHVLSCASRSINTFRDDSAEEPS